MNDQARNSNDQINARQKTRVSGSAALLTTPGTSAIAVIRLAGPEVDAFLVDRFSKPVPIGRCVHGLLRDGDRIIDDALAVRSADWVDLNLHGGTWVVRSAIQLAQKDGFEISDLRSVDGETEIWREVLDALPLAKTEQAVRMLLAQPALWESMAKKLSSSLLAEGGSLGLPRVVAERPGLPPPAMKEPGIDPSDRFAVSELQKIIDDQSGRWLISVPTVAIVGPANVGKSTLANQLFGQARSITADLPGTTRDWVGEVANIDGLAVMLLDTPGQRVTDDPIERAAIVGSAPRIRSADLVILVQDQSQPLNREMLASHPDAITVANKSDATHLWNAAEIIAIETVATDGRGVDDLRLAIRRRFGFESMEIDKIRWWTDRQRSNLTGKITSTEAGDSEPCARLPK